MEKPFFLPYNPMSNYSSNNTSYVCYGNNDMRGAGAAAPSEGAEEGSPKGHRSPGGAPLGDR
jgi:hypothetical protein